MVINLSCCDQENYSSASLTGIEIVVQTISTALMWLAVHTILSQDPAGV